MIMGRLVILVSGLFGRCVDVSLVGIMVRVFILVFLLGLGFERKGFVMVVF